MRYVSRTICPGLADARLAVGDNGALIRPHRPTGTVGITDRTSIRLEATTGDDAPLVAELPQDVPEPVC